MTTPSKARRLTRAQSQGSYTTPKTLVDAFMGGQLPHFLFKDDAKSPRYSRGLLHHPGLVHVVMVLVQVCYAGYHVVTKTALKEGVNQLVFCCYRDLLALSILGPAAYYLDKAKRPPASQRPLHLLFILGFTGIFGNQLLFMFGLHYTSPAMAAAFQPSIPVLTFMLATVTGAEVLHLRRVDGLAKLLGVIVCVSGAVLMALYRGPPVVGDGSVEMLEESLSHAPPDPLGAQKASSDQTGLLEMALGVFGLEMWHVGVLCLIGNCSCMAVYLTVQSQVLLRYPAAVTVTAFAYLFGTLFMVITGLLFVPDLASWHLKQVEFLAVIYAGVFASAFTYGLLTWANEKVGPSLVAMYMPLQPLCTAILSGIFLGTSLYLGSVIGGTLILLGLYLVTWGRAEAERVRLAQIHLVSSSHGPSWPPEDEGLPLSLDGGSEEAMQLLAKE